MKKSLGGLHEIIKENHHMGVVNKLVHSAPTVCLWAYKVIKGIGRNKMGEKIIQK